jgi:nucleotide-binding universal stress UspA family protein
MTSAGPIVVGVDPLRVDLEPLALASRLATVLRASVVAVAAYPHDPLRARATDMEYERTLRDEAMVALSRAAAHLPDGTVTEARASESAARALHEAAIGHDAAVLVVGSAHGGPLGRLAPSSVADRVLHGSRCPVAVAPHGYETAGSGLERIGAAFVDTPEGRAAVRYAAALAARADARLELLTALPWFDPTGMVAPPLEMIEHERREAVALAETAAHRALGRAPAEVTVLTGGPTAELIERTGDLDLLVCGSRGYGPMRAVLLGSVSHALARHARCPVIVVPREAESGREVAGLDQVA